MPASSPFISVVVPAFQRPEGLKALIAALGEQSYPPYRFELLVCDDGSKPSLAEQVPVRESPFTVRFLRGENAGPATARNRGIKEARGAIVAFTDDDCVPEPDWLEAIATAFEDPAVYAAHGPTHSKVPPVDPFIHSVHIQQVHGVATANFAVRRHNLLAVQGFDETFGAPYFEDEDLSQRLQMDFGPITWVAAMRVEHPPRPGSVASAWRGAGFWYYLPHMQRLHPGYWQGAVRITALRSGLKLALVVIGLLPLFGFPPSFAFTWLVLATWQIRRLQRVLAACVTVGWRVPVGQQVAFVLGEWVLDWRRLGSYVAGLRLHPKPRPIEIAELGI